MVAAATVRADAQGKTGRDSFRPHAAGYIGGRGGVKSGVELIIAALAAVGYVCAVPHASIGA